MDGNGRWARKRFMPRVYGHKVGVDALVRTIQACSDRGIKFLSVFAFSSENWKRPSDEVSGLMNLVLVAVSKYLAKLAVHWSISEGRLIRLCRRKPRLAMDMLPGSSWQLTSLLNP